MLHEIMRIPHLRLHARFKGVHSRVISPLPVSTAHGKERRQAAKSSVSRASVSPIDVVYVRFEPCKVLVRVEVDEFSPIVAHLNFQVMLMGQAEP